LSNYIFTFKYILSSYYFTFFKAGFAFFAPADAFLVAAANIAPADSLLIPCFLAISDCTALNPGCAFDFAILFFF
jgi:hypothetical protein